MPTLSTLKSKQTQPKNALAKEEGEANELLKQDWTDGNEQQIGIFSDGNEQHGKFV